MSFNINEITRAKRIIEETISLLDINLSGLKVLTEVGSNSFIYTPLIALMANAKHVYAWTKDSQYGIGQNIVDECLMIAEILNLDRTKLTFAINKRVGEHVQNADIITNSGMIRPLNKDILQHANDKAVIPLMYEAWELREEEIDKEYCFSRGIKIGGTWENHPDLCIFEYCGPLGIKLLHEAGLEVYRNRILIWSNDHFGAVIEQACHNAGAKEIILTNDIEVLEECIDRLDAILLCDYKDNRPLVAENGLLKIDLIKRKNSALVVVHLYGLVDYDYSVRNGLTVYPHRNGKAAYMTFTLAHVGLNPILKLQAAGLKVGELLFKNIEHSLCQIIV